MFGVEVMVRGARSPRLRCASVANGLDVRPRLSPFDLADGVVVKAQFPRDASRRFTCRDASADAANVVLGELRKTRAGADGRVLPPAFALVAHVVGVRSKPKVRGI